MTAKSAAASTGGPGPVAARISGALAAYGSAPRVALRAGAARRRAHVLDDRRRADHAAARRAGRARGGRERRARRAGVVACRDRGWRRVSARHRDRSREHVVHRPAVALCPQRSWAGPPCRLRWPQECGGCCRAATSRGSGCSGRSSRCSIANFAWTVVDADRQPGFDPQTGSAIAPLPATLDRGRVHEFVRPGRALLPDRASQAALGSGLLPGVQRGLSRDRPDRSRARAGCSTCGFPRSISQPLRCRPPGGSSAHTGTCRREPRQRFPSC